MFSAPSDSPQEVYSPDRFEAAVLVHRDRAPDNNNCNYNDTANTTLVCTTVEPRQATESDSAYKLVHTSWNNTIVAGRNRNESSIADLISYQLTRETGV